VLYQFDGQTVDINALNDEALRKIRWENISYMPQGSMNVLNPVRRIRKTFKDFVGAHRDITKEKGKFDFEVKEHLRHLGLPQEALYAYPHQLSGGMKQRVTIALATILNPTVIIADEPTTALDVVVQRGVVQLFKKIQAEQKNTVIMVTHDMAIHANMADRLAIMYAGRIVEEAKVDDIFFSPLHPYTKFLIGSLPEIGDKSYKISAPGAPPNLAHPPEGCRFNPRCPETEPRCREAMPELVTVGEEHRVACFLVSGETNNGE
jgi:peptide/nickel transport system ATP-binding protein